MTTGEIQAVSALLIVLIGVSVWWYRSSRSAQMLGTSLLDAVDPATASDTRKQLASAGALGGVDFVVDKLFDISRVDLRAVEALKFASSGDPDWLSLPGIAEGVLTAPKSLDRMLGYVGENVVAAELAGAGYVVDFPDSPNEPGIDLYIDGQPYQVKTTLAQSALTEHLQRYPAIPVIAPEELIDSAVAADPRVEFVPGFSHASTSDLAQAGMEQLAGLDSLASNVPIPIFSGGFIAYRQFQHVRYGGKSPIEALKDTAIQTTGSVAGAAVGGTAGLAVGAAATAAGTAVSSAVGWSTATAVAAGLASAGGKLGMVAGGAAFLVLGPLAAGAAVVGGAMGGAALGKHLAMQWRMRGVNVKQEAVYEAIELCGRKFSEAMTRRLKAHREKYDARLEPAGSTIAGARMLLRRLRGKVRDERSQLRLLSQEDRYSRPVAGDGDLEANTRKWAERTLTAIAKHPVLDAELVKAVEQYQAAAAELAALLKKRGLAR